MCNFFTCPSAFGGNISISLSPSPSALYSQSFLQAKADPGHHNLPLSCAVWGCWELKSKAYGEHRVGKGSSKGMGGFGPVGCCVNAGGCLCGEAEPAASKLGSKEVNKDVPCERGGEGEAGRVRP